MRNIAIKILLWGGLAYSLYPLNCYAYLDPGSGNALIALVLSLAGAAVYFVKSFFYRILALLTGNKVAKTDKSVPDYVIFSEGKAYYLTFKGIIEEFLARRIPFTYLTMDVQDPALEISDRCMHAKYVGSGTMGFGRVEKCRGKILLATTPNIGCPGFPLRRPRNIRLMVNVFHAVGELTYLKLGSLDHYDVSFDQGPWVAPRTRIVEEKRHLKAKQLFPIGIPYLDELVKEHQAAPADDHAGSDGKPCILIAPSWGEKNCLKIFGTEFITALLDEGYEVILRPHPQSLKVEADFFGALVSSVKSYPNFQYDTALSGTASMQKASLLISDASAFRFDFAFIYQKPVITLKVPAQDLSSYEASVIGSVWEDPYEGRLGAVLSENEKNEIPARVKELLGKDFSEADRKLYAELVSNPGTSAKAAVDKLIELNKTL